MKRYLIFLLIFFPFLSCPLHDLNNPHDPCSEAYHAPSGFTASRGILNHIVVRWEETPYASEYMLYRNSDNDPVKENILVTSATSYNDFNVLYGITYYYTIKARLTTGIITRESAVVEGYRNLPSPGLVIKQINGENSFYSLGEQAAVDDNKFRGFKIELDNLYPGLRLMYMAHIQAIGDTDWINDGEFVDSRQQTWCIEGFAIKTAGAAAEQFSVTYKAFFRGADDQPFVSEAANGEYCPTIDKTIPLKGSLEFIEVLLVATDGFFQM